MVSEVFKVIQFDTKDHVPQKYIFLLLHTLQSKECYTLQIQTSSCELVVSKLVNQLELFEELLCDPLSSLHEP